MSDNTTVSPARGKHALGPVTTDRGLLTSWTTWITLLAMYMGLCSLLRFRFEKAMRRAFNYPDRASLARMTNDDAQSILQYIITKEFPYFYKLSLQFAIFKTYGFPTMSRLVASTGNFTDPGTAPKRYEDTVVIFGEFSLNPPTSERCIRAISRMNYLHSQWKAAGRISNADFLYTLAVCVMEPIRFCKQFEWRSLNEMEMCAIGTFWKSIGDAMEIKYKGYLSKDQWEDGLEFAEDITAWAKAYEVEAMKPDVANTKPARQLVDMLTFQVPSFLKPFALEVLTVLMGDRVREAFLYPEPPISTALAAYAGLSIRRVILRYLALPRLFPIEFFSEPDPKTGRIYHWDYLVHPWYHKATFWSRWGPLGLFTRLIGGTVPGTDGNKMMPQGFLFEDIGPANQVGKGLDVMAREEQRLRRERPSSCPFA